MSPWSFIRRPIRSMCLLSLALLGASACKPVDEPDDSDQPAMPIEPEDAASVLAHQICAEIFACECPDALEYADEAECVAQAAAQIAAQINPVLDAGGTWDPECAGQMAKAMSDWKCLGPTLAARESSFSPVTCPVLKGVLGLNANCYSSSLGDDCSVGLLCLNGTCVVPPQLPVPSGQQCYYGALPCESGYCDWDQDFNTQICQALPETGDACSVDQYLSCGPAANDLVCEAGTCAPTPGEGESCQDFNLCGPGLYCDGGTDPFTCQPRQELGEGCGADAVCPVDASCITNICEADAAAICGATNLF